MSTVNEIILQAYAALGVIQDTSETISTTLRDNAFLVLQQAYSRSSAERLLAYLVVHGSFTPTAGTATYTLGTGGTFATAARPVAVTGWKSQSGAFVNGGEPLSFDALRKKQVNPAGVTGVLVMDLAADQGFPSINIELFPTPAASPGTLTIDYWTPLVQFTAVTDNLTLPDGYEAWLVAMLATELEPRFPVEGGRPELTRKYAECKAAITNRVAAILAGGAPPVAA